MKSILLSVILLSAACQNTSQTTTSSVTDPQRNARVAAGVHVAKKYTVVVEDQRKLAAQLTYNAEGLLTEEVTYRGGKPASTVVYTYHPDFSVNTASKNGKPHMRRLLQDGGRTVVEETFLLHDTLRTVYENDAQGRHLMSETSKAGQVRTQNTYTWSVTGDTLRVLQEAASGPREFVQVLHQGRVIKEQRFADGAEVYLEENTYSPEGLPTFQKRIDKAGCAFTTTFTYQAGLLQSEVNGFECEGQVGQVVYVWEYERFE